MFKINELFQQHYLSDKEQSFPFIPSQIKRFINLIESQHSAKTHSELNIRFKRIVVTVIQHVLFNYRFGSLPKFLLHLPPLSIMSPFL